MVRRMVRTVAAAAWFLFVGQAAAAAEWLEVLRTDASGVDLLLRAPEPVRDGEDWRVPEFDAFGAPGWPVTAEIAATFGVPDAAGARLRILDVVWRELGRTTPARGAAQVSSHVVSDPTVARKPAPVDFGAAYPSEPVTLSGTAELRGRHVVTLTYLPVQYRRDGNAAYAREVRARLEFESRPRPAAPGAAAEPLHAALANADQAAAWARAATAARPTPPRTTALPASRLRLRIAQRGLYTLTRADLVAAGLSNATLDGIDARTFRLYFPPWNTLPLLADSVPGSWQSDWEMTQSALWIPGEEDGNFGSEDRMYFYALGPAGYVDLAGLPADSLQHARHPYDRNYYGWLVWGDGVFHTPMLTVDATPGANDSVRTRVWHREHFEEDQVYGIVDDLWAWQEIRASRAAIVNFNLDLGGVPAAAGRLRVGVGHGDPLLRGARHGVLVKLNGIEIGTGRWQQNSTFGAFFDFPFSNARPGSNNLNVSLLPDTTLLARAELLKFDLAWDRPLVADISKTLAWSSRPATGAETFGITGFDAVEPLLLDVSDASHPRRLSGLTAAGSGPATQWQARAGTPGVRAHYFATSLVTPRRPAQILLRNVANLRNRSTAPDMLIVTHETDTGGPTDLRAAAQRLAAHRGAHWPGGGTPDILIATTRDIYENFSGGRLDPLAVRNYVKYLYQLDATPRLRFLLLFGDGSHDPRQLLRGTSPTLVPALEPWYADDRFKQDYAVEDWLGEMQTPNNRIGPDVGTSSAVPDLGVGRIAARSISEAQAIVDKIIAYEAAGPGVWRSRVLLSADDECHIGVCFETFHIGNTETLASRMPGDLDPVKLYMTEYPETLGQKPQARAAFIRAWNEGCVLLNYQGHGAPRQLSDEVLFLSTDIPSLQNGVKLPLFLPISCTVSEFDAPEQQSMCEDLLAYVPGGIIGSVGATTPTYVGPNFAFNLELFRAVFEGEPRKPLGIILLLAKTRSPSGSGRFNETYMLIGDPSLPLGLPRSRARFDSGAETLRTGERTTITGSVLGLDSLLASNFQGQVDVEVFAHADTSGYRRPNVAYQLYIPYDLVGPPIYRGTVPAAGGHFSFQFHVPVGARLGTRGRVSAYAYDAAGFDAKGARANVHVVTGSNTDSSLAAPRIVLSFPNGRTRVKAGTPLLATLADENGINIQGTSLQNSILVDFDGLGEPVNVTSEFRYSSGSDSVGSLSVALPALNPGPHAVTLIASDNLLQTATATLPFEVLAEASVRLLNVLAFPNPFRDWTRFMFEITDPAEVEVEVFTTSGRRVWQGKQSFETGVQGSIKWDGVDQGEDRLANGTYLYTLRARPTLPGSPELKYTGKVVLMR